MNEYLNENYQPAQPSLYKKELIEITDWKKASKVICVYRENRPKKAPTDFNKLSEAIVEEGENLAPVIITPIKEDDKNLFYLDENFNYIPWPEDWPRPLYGIPDGNNKFFFCRRNNFPCVAMISEKADRTKIKILNISGSFWKTMDFILHNTKLPSEFLEGAKKLLKKVEEWKLRGFKIGSIVNIFSKDTSKVKDTIKKNCYNYTDENEEVLRIAFSVEPFMSAYTGERFLKTLKWYYKTYPNWNPEFFKIGLQVVGKDEVDQENWNNAKSIKPMRNLILKYTDIGRDNEELRAAERRSFNNPQRKLIIEQEKKEGETRCHRCSKKMTEKEALKNIDHYPIPYSIGKGQKPTNIDNGKLCCKKCNELAGNFMTEEQKNKQLEIQKFSLKIT